MGLSRKTNGHSKISPSRTSTPSRTGGPSDFAVVVAISIALAALVWIVFGQTRAHQYINYDDPLYVLNNPHINRGLSWPAVQWAFTHVHSQNWHPLTSISHMLDCQLFGVQPGPQHLVNVLFHGIATILLFLFLQRTTGARWTSAFVAAVFAIHPLRVESVAWISERKDVLSGTFFMLTLLSYAAYARNRSLGRYLLICVCLSCGLMSKPMLVTTPVVLCLLDYWPLGRDAKSEVGGQRSEVSWNLLLEKVPLFALSLGSIVATLWAQNFALGSTETLPLRFRLTNAVVSCVAYVRDTFWPHDLIPFYIHPENRLSVWAISGAALLLVAISAVAITRRRQNPYLLVGWCWYLVMLLPVIGLVQVGLQARADRYTYLPQIGLLIGFSWLVRDVSVRWRKRVYLLAPAAAASIAALTILAWKQTAHWRDTETLWSYTLAVTPDSDVAHTGLAGILFVRGEVDDAIAHYRRALQLRSGNSGAQYGLAVALEKERKVDEASEHYRKALELQPDNIDASKALALLDVHRGDFSDAVAQWENVLRYEPDDGDALNNVAWVLATSTDPALNDPQRALQYAERASRIAHDSNPAVLRTLAVAYGENHRFAEATATAERAVQIAQTSGRAELAEDIKRYLEVFRAGKSWRESRTQ